MQKQILLVDDDPKFRAAFVLAASECSCTVVQTTSIREAEFELLSRDFDLLVVDGLLRDGHGPSWLKSLRRRKIIVPAVFVSAHHLDTFTFQEMMRNLDLSLILEKPVALGVLRKEISSLLEFAHPLTLSKLGEQEKEMNGVPRAILFDEETSFALRLKALLGSEGALTYSFRDLAYAESVMNDISPNLVLIDSSFFLHGGFDLCRSLRQNPSWKDVQIMALVEASDLKMRLDAFDAGASGTLNKSMTNTNLLSSLTPILKIGGDLVPVRNTSLAAYLAA